MEEKKRIPVTNIIIIILLIFSLALNGFVGYKMLTEDKAVTASAENKVEEKIYSADDLSDMIIETMNVGYDEGYNDFKLELKQQIINGNGVNIALREIFSDEIIYVYDNKYVFKPINTELELNKLDADKFIVNDKDLSTYTIEYRDGNFEGYKGIDVSKFQGDIDWEKVAEDGVDFAFVRAGYRGYETGKLVEDEKCKENIENALKNHINTGVYFYTQAISEEEAVEEAEFVIDIVKDYDINYPIAFDLEVVGEEIARTNGLSAEERVKIVKAFCEKIEEAGYTPMLYGNLATMFSMVEYEEVLDYEKWFAYYDTELYFPYDLAVWQYSCTGSVDGIEGECDLNLSFKDLSAK